MSDFRKEVIEEIQNIAPNLSEKDIYAILEVILKNEEKYQYGIAELKILIEKTIQIIDLFEYDVNNSIKVSTDLLNEYYIEAITKIKSIIYKLNIPETDIIPTWGKLSSLRGNYDFFDARGDFYNYTSPTNSDLLYLDEVISPIWIKNGKPPIDLSNTDLLDIINKINSAILEFTKRAGIKNPTYTPEYYELTKDNNNNIYINGLRINPRNISVGTLIEKLIEAIFKHENKEFNPHNIITTAKPISNMLENVGISKNLRKLFFPNFKNKSILFTSTVSREEALSRGVNLFQIDYELERQGISSTHYENTETENINTINKSQQIDLDDIPF